MEDPISSHPAQYGELFLPEELPGRFHKYLDVPENWRGVVIQPAGSSLVLPPGYHKVLSFWGRLGNRGVGMLVGRVSSQPYPLLLRAGYLRSQDSEWLDCSILLTLRVSDPVAYFKSVLRLDRRLIPARPGEAELRALLNPLAQDYQAVDLFSSMVTQRLRVPVHAGLARLLASSGQEVLSVDVLEFLPTSRRVEIARQRQVINAQLQDVRLQEQMRAVENNAQLADFIQQLTPQAEQAMPVPDVEHKNQKPGVVAEKYIRLQVEPEEAIQKSIAAPIRRPPNPNAGWWLGHVLWMSFLVLAAIVSTFLILNLVPDETTAVKLGLLLSVWTFAFNLVIKAYLSMVEKREKISTRMHVLTTRSLIDDLAGDGCARVDQLVREQAGNELSHLVEILESLMRKLTQKNLLKPATAIREMRDLASSLQKRIRNDLSYGTPPYLRNWTVSEQTWARMLDDDQDLLIYLAGISDHASSLNKLDVTAIPQAQIDQLGKDLLTFEHNFASRTRPFRQGGEDPNNRK